MRVGKHPGQRTAARGLQGCRGGGGRWCHPRGRDALSCFQRNLRRARVRLERPVARERVPVLCRHRSATPFAGMPEGSVPARPSVPGWGLPARPGICHGAAQVSGQLQARLQQLQCWSSTTCPPAAFDPGCAGGEVVRCSGTRRRRRRLLLLTMTGVVQSERRPGAG